MEELIKITENNGKQAVLGSRPQIDYVLTLDVKNIKRITYEN